MADKIRITLPKKYDLVVGDTFQLYYRGVVEAPNPYVYSIVSICEKGRNFPRYFEFLPTEPGQHKLTIRVYDAQRNLLGEGETTLNVVVPKEPANCTNILVIGDSLTGGGHWINEARRRITEEGGAPAGLGFKNAIKFVGSSKGYYADSRNEGYGGWHIDSFLYNVPGAMWIECPNSRTPEDHHSLWQDVNGALWQLETMQIDYLKFNRWKDHTSPRPEHGPLTHYANAADTSPIEFTHSSTAGGSPFVNPDTGKIDFGKQIGGLVTGHDGLVIVEPAVLLGPVGGIEVHGDDRSIQLLAVHGHGLLNLDTDPGFGRFFRIVQNADDLADGLAGHDAVLICKIHFLAVGVKHLLYQGDTYTAGGDDVVRCGAGGEVCQSACSQDRQDQYQRGHNQESLLHLISSILWNSLSGIIFYSRRTYTAVLSAKAVVYALPESWRYAPRAENKGIPLPPKPGAGFGYVGI